MLNLVRDLVKNTNLLSKIIIFFLFFLGGVITGIWQLIVIGLVLDLIIGLPD